MLRARRRLRLRQGRSEQPEEWLPPSPSPRFAPGRVPSALGWRPVIPLALGAARAWPRGPGLAARPLGRGSGPRADPPGVGSATPRRKRDSAMQRLRPPHLSVPRETSSTIGTAVLMSLEVAREWRVVEKTTSAVRALERGEPRGGGRASRRRRARMDALGAAPLRGGVWRARWD